ncbi:hypothetical protein [Brevibacillus brevis]|uniref:hypothetical protein n=1 Tax=Brevibacillus brevis TaxID=1393 RepID=UPI00115C382C|nr:hypothetical protein [Lysinibacillus sp. SDF0063]TQR38596.1 hypothetical protein C7Y45_00570 [Lysinibacillus sp. SDF0063]
MIKKFMTLGAVVSVLTFGSQAAFASDGWADSKETAHAINDGGSFFQTISDSTDVDWYVYRNNSDKSNWVFELQSPAGINYDYDWIAFGPNGEYILSGTAGDLGPGQIDAASAGGIGFGKGVTVYFKVRGHSSQDFDSRHAYAVYLSAW